MLFHTLDFFVFLPIVVFLFWGLPRRWRLPLLACSSLVFYASWSVSYLPVLLCILLISWGGSLWIWRTRRSPGQRLRQGLIIGGLLAPLLYFKYWNWIAENIDWVTAALGLPQRLGRVDLALPVGISFFTFQALAYVIDVGRMAREAPAPDPSAAEKSYPGSNDQPEQSLLHFGTFLAFFPQLVAGPIVRRKELLPQLRSLPLLRHDDVGAGIFRILRGLAKKVLIADVLRLAIVDPVFTEPDRFASIEILVALYAYTLQIYCDFSGYTDIAVGVARLFGIKLPENFRQPYKATSVAEFWRRWHITLSNWVRDYIYYPLGGSQVTGGQWRVYVNIWLTLLIIGIWHGASWNFVVYGTLHGIAVGINRWQRKRTGRRPGDPLPGAWAFTWRWLLTFHFVVLARILFRAPDLGTSAHLALSLLDISLILPRFSPVAWAVMALGYALHFTPERLNHRIEGWFKVQSPAAWAFAAAGLSAVCMAFGTGESLAFVYYQF